MDALYTPFTVSVINFDPECFNCGKLSCLRRNSQFGFRFHKNNGLLANTLHFMQVSCSFLSLNRWVSDGIFHWWQRDDILVVVCCFWSRMTTQHPNFPIMLKDIITTTLSSLVSQGFWFIGGTAIDSYFCGVVRVNMYLSIIFLCQVLAMLLL